MRTGILGSQEPPVTLRLICACCFLITGSLVYLVRAAGVDFPALGQAPSFLHATGFVVLLSLFDVRLNVFLVSASLIFSLSAILEWVQISGSVFYFGTFDYFDLVASLAGAILGVAVLSVTLGRARVHHA